MLFFFQYSIGKGFLKNLTCSLAPIAVKILPFFLREIVEDSGRNDPKKTKISAPKNLKSAS
jgi:cytochrome c biogenesis protein CcdA